MPPPDLPAVVSGSHARSCPFCGFTGRISIERVPTTNPAFHYKVAHCQRCGAQGPFGWSDTEAAQGWNARLEPLGADDFENGEPFLERPKARSVRVGDPRYWPVDTPPSQVLSCSQSPSAHSP